MISHSKNINNAWQFIPGLCIRLYHGLDTDASDAAIKMLNKLLHEEQILNARTSLNGGYIAYKPTKDFKYGILQLSSDCKEDEYSYDWYDELAQATEILSENKALQKFELDVQILSVLPS